MGNWRDVQSPGELSTPWCPMRRSCEWIRQKWKTSSFTTTFSPEAFRIFILEWSYWISNFLPRYWANYSVTLSALLTRPSWTLERVCTINLLEEKSEKNQRKIIMAVFVMFLIMFLVIVGVYLGPSIMDHSCERNATYYFDGPSLCVKAIKPVASLSDVSAVPGTKDFCDAFLLDFWLHFHVA